MRHVETLYLAWHSHREDTWYTVGRLDCDSDVYRFKYLAGSVIARREADFGGVAQFPDESKEYQSTNLFAFVENRVLSENRPEYEDHTRRLGLEPEDLRPFDRLSRSNGRRVTDTFELYPAPLESGDRISLHFFSRGVRYLDDALKELWKKSEPTSPLRLKRDRDNEHDPYAIEILDDEGRELGYVPRYYTQSLAQILDANCSYEVELVQHNKEPGYVRERFLLRLDAQTPEGWYFPQSDEYDAVSSVLEAEHDAA